jgi:hypothetical protein
MEYKLTGVVVHSGTALFGHYTSLVRDKAVENKWYLFNDLFVSVVTTAEALNTAYGHGGVRNGYLLFYQRTDVFNANETEPPIVGPQLQSEIAEANSLNDEYRLYCSSPYFELMKILANANKEASKLIALQYYFDTFPFTTHVSHARQIAEPLIQQLKIDPDLRSLLVEFLLRGGPYACALIYSSDGDLRSFTQRIFETI